MEEHPHARSTITPEVASSWQDMLALTTSRVRDLLQAVLRSKSVLKVSCKLIKARVRQWTQISTACELSPGLVQVGFGLVLDLWAIARAVGSEGLNCVAVVEPQLDLGTLHRQLLKDRLPDVRMVRRLFCVIG